MGRPKESMCPEFASEAEHKVTTVVAPPVPCAACRSIRRKCTADCLLAPWFPSHEADGPENFQNVKDVFGVGHVTKFLRKNPSRAEDVMESLIYEANARKLDPVQGAYGIVKRLEDEVQRLTRLLGETANNSRCGTSTGFDGHVPSVPLLGFTEDRGYRFPSTGVSASNPGDQFPYSIHTRAVGTTTQHQRSQSILWHDHTIIPYSDQYSRDIQVDEQGQPSTACVDPAGCIRCQPQIMKKVRAGETVKEELPSLDVNRSISSLPDGDMRHLQWKTRI